MVAAELAARADEGLGVRAVVETAECGRSTAEPGAEILRPFAKEQGIAQTIRHGGEWRRAIVAETTCPRRRLARRYEIERRRIETQPRDSDVLRGCGLFGIQFRRFARAQQGEHFQPRGFLILRREPRASLVEGSENGRRVLLPLIDAGE